MLLLLLCLVLVARNFCCHFVVSTHTYTGTLAHTTWDTPQRAEQQQFIQHICLIYIYNFSHRETPKSARAQLSNAPTQPQLVVCECVCVCSPVCVCVWVCVCVCFCLLHLHNRWQWERVQLAHFAAASHGNCLALLLSPSSSLYAYSPFSIYSSFHHFTILLRHCWTFLIAAVLQFDLHFYSMRQSVQWACILPPSLSLFFSLSALPLRISCILSIIIIFLELATWQFPVYNPLNVAFLSWDSQRSFKFPFSLPFARFNEHFK